MVGASHVELVSKLRAATGKTAGVKRAVVFVFSGQGSQYLGMGRELISTSPLFKDIVCRCHAELLGLGYAGVLTVLDADPEDKVEMEAKQRIEGFQCAVFVLEYALAKLWISWGVKPTSVIGHRYGCFLLCGEWD